MLLMELESASHRSTNGALSGDPQTVTEKSATIDELRAEFAPIFARIAEGAQAREVGRILPFEEVRLLKEAGFGSLRLSVSDGGRGATLEQF